MLATRHDRSGSLATPGRCIRCQASFTCWAWHARGWATLPVPPLRRRRPRAWRRRRDTASRPTPWCGSGLCKAGKPRPRERLRARPGTPKCKGKDSRRSTRSGRPQSSTTVSRDTTRRCAQPGEPPRNAIEPWHAMWALPELVEAAARAGDVELAGDALERLARDDAARWHRSRTRHRSALPRSPERRAGGRRPLPRSD